MAQLDLYNIEERLREWDENILRVDWDARKLRHRIICRDERTGEEYIAMTVPLGQLDARVVNRMMEINPKRGYNPFHEIDRARAAKERRDEIRISEMAHGMADVLHKPLINHAFY